MNHANANATHEGLADVYDSLVDWPRRLRFEGPFFRRFFEQHRVRRVLDAGCGTGHHAALFHSWNLEGVGMDLSSSMLKQCSELHGESRGLCWVERSLCDAPPPGAMFDAVVCIGNSLAIADERKAVEKAVKNLVASVRPGGVGAFQVLNLGAIEAGPTIWQKVGRIGPGDRPLVILKGLHHHGGRGYIDIVTLELPNSELCWQSQRAAFLAITEGDMRSWLDRAGATVSETIGSYSGEPFDSTKSNDLIVGWRRRGIDG